MDIVFLISRLVLGAYFVISGLKHYTQTSGTAGYGKMRGLPVARLGVLVTGAVLMLSGLGIIFGLYVVWSLWAIAGFLVLAAFSVHHFWTDKDPASRAGEQINFGKNLALAAALLMLLSVPMPWPALF